MRNLTLERQLSILREIEASKTWTRDRDKRLVDCGSNITSLLETPIPFLLRDFGGLGGFNPKGATEVFYKGTPASSTNPTTDWRSTLVPTNATMALMIAAGSGAGGGAGLTAATSTAKGGGAGGGSGGVARLLIPTRFIPAQVFYWAGQGGLGGITSGGAGAVGSRSWITDSSPITFAGDAPPNFGGILIQSGGTAAQGGTGGASSGAAALGAAETAAGINLFAALGLWTSVAGAAGSAGGNAATPTAGGNLTWGGTNGSVPFCGGTGGGAASSGNSVTNGGTINTAGNMMNLVGGTGVAGGPGGAGLNGHSLGNKYSGFLSNGGTGGGASATAGLGGNGGKGGDYCSGGGGGGGGVTAGSGGNGGTGFVYFLFW